MGNKRDLANQRSVEFEEAAEFAKKHNMRYMETSAYDNSGISIVLVTILKGRCKKSL